MAFESFRTQGRRSSKLRGIVIGVAALFHGALIASGVVYSYWHVDELTPPTLRVTFIAAAPPPPPPPPPPPAGGGGAKKVAMKPKTIPTPTVVPKPIDIVQPREKPVPQVVVKKEFRKHDDEEEEEDDDAPKSEKGGVKGGTIGGVEGGTIGGTVGGTIGGTKGGTIGGTVGGTVGAPMSPKILPPNLGALQRQGCADPPFPASLRRVDSFYLVMAKVCVAATGKVEGVTLMKRADSLLDEGVVSSEKACHYKPLMAGGLAVPFCYIARYEFKGQ